MPENDDVDFEDLLGQIDDSAPPLAKQLRGVIRTKDKQMGELKQALAAAQEQAARVTQLERDALFGRGGIPDDGFGAIFKKAYDGEQTVEAIKAAWATLTGQATQDDAGARAEDERLTAEMSAADRMANASASPLNASKEQAYENELRGAKTQAETIAVLRKYGKLDSSGS